jgi:hypothetical protein
VACALDGEPLLSRAGSDTGCIPLVSNMVDSHWRLNYEDYGVLDSL